MRNLIVVVMLLAGLAGSVSAEDVYLSKDSSQFFQREHLWSEPFVTSCKQGFAAAYKDCAKAEELGYGYCLLPNNRGGSYQSTWFAFRDSNGLVKVVFNRFLADCDLYQIEDSQTLQAWTHSQVTSTTKNGEIVWDTEHYARYTTVRTDTQASLEDIFQTLKSLKVVSDVAKGSALAD